MTIDEILANAGIEDAEAVAKVKAEMPKAFMPLAEANKRIAAANKAKDEAAAALESYKQEVEQAAEEAKKNGEAGATALAELQAKYEKLQGDFTESQNAMKQRDAKEALIAALKEAGANPAAIELLANSALAGVEFGEDGKPSNVQAVADGVKESNAGLFGVSVDTGRKQEKADEGNDLDPFEGFGDVTPRK